MVKASILKKLLPFHRSSTSLQTSDPPSPSRHPVSSMTMLSSEIQPSLDPAQTQTFSIMKVRSNSISTSHLSLKPTEFNDELKTMDEVLQNIPAEAAQIDIPIREIVEDSKPKLNFNDLPVEVHECILDHIFGIRASTSSTSNPGQSSAVRGWSSILRHPRRKALSDFALVSETWRPLVQERLFRHIKIRGTHVGLWEVDVFFRNRQHFLHYVKHVEVWIPVWGDRAVPATSSTHLLDQDPTRSIVTFTTAVDRNNPRFEDSATTNVVYNLASHNASLEDIFTMTKLFTQARILTLEGGHCKKPPMVQHFHNREGTLRPRDLPTIENITTLVLRGAWNIMRDVNHYCDVVRAFPNVREWHCSYAKPKLEAYATIHNALPILPNRLTHLNITIDGFYNKALTPSGQTVSQHSPEVHLCPQLGRIAPTLEALSFTGRVCSSFFTSMRKHTPSTGSHLRSLDLNVKNCCRSTSKSLVPLFADPINLANALPTFANTNAPPQVPITINTPLTHDGLGPAAITNYAFILAFEAVVHASIQSLTVLPSLTFIRIRFIDLDSVCPLLNPYFQLKNNECTGLWSDSILYALNEARPDASFKELGEGIEFGKSDSGEMARDEGAVLGGDGANGQEGVAVLWPKGRPVSMRVGAFVGLAEGLKV